jgi:hypothetical protein
VARLANDVPVPQELLGDSGLSRVRVAYDGESAAFLNFCVHGSKARYCNQATNIVFFAAIHIKNKIAFAATLAF